MMDLAVTVGRRYAARGIAIALIVALYHFAQIPTLSAATEASLASQFEFVTAPLPTLPATAPRTLRRVNPSLGGIQSWISAVGAAVALADLDGDGLPNDVCYIDPRTDQVIVAPVPGTSPRYAPFALDPVPLPYSPSTMAPMGCLPGAFDEGGVEDLLVYYWGRSPIIFLRRDSQSAQGAVRLSRDLYVPREVVTPFERWNTNAVTQADLTGDGHVDLVVGNYFPDSDHVLDANATDLEQMQHSMSRASNGGGLHFLLWSGATRGQNPTVRYTEASAGLDPETLHGWTLALGAASLDGTLLPDIYVANDFGPDHLLDNRSSPGHLSLVPLEGRRDLTTPKSKVLGHDSFKGMGVDIGDLFGRGRFDILVSNITSEYALEESNFAFVNTGEVGLMGWGVAPFVDQSEELGLSRSGWSWDVKLADFVNSGIPEVVQATGFLQGTVNRWPELQELAMGNDELLSDPLVWPHFRPGDDLSGHQHTRFFARAPDGRYYDIAPDLGLGDPLVSRGIAIADVYGDGRLDFAVANQWDTSYFYRNVSPSPGAFLGLHLLLPLPGARALVTTMRPGHPAADTPGMPAIGAQALVYLPDGRKILTQVDGGNGHSGKRSPDVHVGLGHVDADQPIRVDLRWRDSSGRIHRDTLRLHPGWYTVLLGSPDGQEN